MYAHTRFRAVFHCWDIINFHQPLDDRNHNRVTNKEVITMNYDDKQITCFDCGTVFTFSAGEQEQFAYRGYTNAPKRCPTCRAKRKQNTTGNSSYSSSGSGTRNYSSGPRQMFPAKCTTCGKDTEVPLNPGQEGRSTVQTATTKRIQPRNINMIIGWPSRAA